MKIDIVRQSLKMKVPLLSSNGTVVERRGFLVRVSADGLVGRGESFPLAMFGTEGERECEAALARFAVPRVPETLAGVAVLLESLNQVPTARFGVECALLEWMAQKKRVSVRQLLRPGKPASPLLQVNALLEGVTVDALVTRAKQAVDDGFKTLKLKAGARTLRVEAERLFAIRRAVGDNVKIRLDANQGWTESRARTALRGLSGLHLQLCEQPLPAGDVEGLRRLRGLGCSIAADESLIAASRRSELLAFDPKPAVDVLVLKPAVLGGLVPTIDLAVQAAAAGVTSYVTTFLDGPVSRAACSQVAALIDSPLAHGLSTLDMFEGQFVDAYTPRDGAIRVSDEPGWGVP
jgi:L-Ala-D/L-Glu epimerase